MRQLSTGRTISYAAGGVAMNLTNLVISQWLVARYVPDKHTALIPAVWLGAFIILGRITDALVDPVIGYFSDNLRSRLGRRIPFILWGLVPFAAVFFAIWVPPTGWPPWLLYVYVFVMLQLYFTLYTVVVGPYLALIPELSTDRKERLNITTVQAIFVTIGALLFGASGWLLERFEQHGWAAVGGAVAIVTILSFLPVLLVIREKPQPERPKTEAETVKQNLWAWSLSTFRNAPFLRVAISTAFYWFGLSLMLLVLPAWVEHFLKLKPSAVTTAMGPFLATNVLFFLAFNVLAKRFGKYMMFLITLIGTAVTFPLLALVGGLPFGDKLTQTAVVMGICGVPVAGFLMLPYALLADVVDYDATLTGRRREAIYIGVQAIFQKTAIGMAAVVYLWLAFLGDSGVPTEFNLKLLAGISGVACAVGFVVFLPYSLRDRPAVEKTAG